MASQIKHLITGDELSPVKIMELIQQAKQFKWQRRQKIKEESLKGHSLALLFDKPSLRTRFSFAIAMQEMGGNIIESVSSTRKQETPEDQAKVLSGYCHAVMVRTHDDDAIVKMKNASHIPIVNGLSNLHHPCQILADLMTLQEHCFGLQGITLAYIGDGNNILHSLLLLAPQMGVTVHYACPEKRGPNPIILEQALAKLDEHSGKIKAFATPSLAVQKAHAVYTDVWTSMGCEEEAAEHLFTGFQVNEALMQEANARAIFMHCLPMERGKEVSLTLPDQACSVIYEQSENRLHMQKAILQYLLLGKNHD